MPATPAAITAALSDESSFASTMVAALLADWGPAWLRWSPSTVLMEVRDDFGVNLPQSRLDRLMAGVFALTDARAFSSVPDFCTLCSAINGHGYDPSHWDPPSAVDVAWAVTEATILEHMILGRPTDQSEPFSADVRHFIGAVCREEGLISPPDVLRLAISDAADRDARIIASWSDDQDTYLAIHTAAADRSAAIVAEIKGRLRLMVGQLERVFGQEIPLAAALGR